MSRSFVAAIAVLCLSALSVYTSYTTLDNADPWFHRTFRAASVERHQLALAGQEEFPFQWRMLGDWAVKAGERLTGADPHAVDVVLKVMLLALSAWALALFSARVVSPAGVVAVLGVYFGLSSAGYALNGYSIYLTNDYAMVAGWFWAVYFASTNRWAAMAAAVFVAAWAKETLVLAPLLALLLWRRGRIPFAWLALVGMAFAIPQIALRLTFRAPITAWSWWDVTSNVPFIVWDRTMIALALRANAKVLMFYSVGWWLAVRAVRRLRDAFLTDLALTLGCYLVLLYCTVRLRELRHLLPMAIGVLPLAIAEFEALSLTKVRRSA